ncbi:MAG: metal ABC transporter ATP-binding protein [Pseudomonadota bacterium]
MEAKGLAVTLAGRRVLRDVDISIASGEIVTIVGPNGSGKSSLLKALIGAVPVSDGAVKRRSGIRIGYVPQKLEIDATMPITAARFVGKGGETALARCGVAECAGRQLSELSGGQVQRVLLARALTAEPTLLLLDEPTQGLDQPGAADFYELIEDVRTETGAAVLMVSHDLHVVMSASDRVICLNGHVCCEGAPSVVSSAPEYRALFGFGTRGALALYQHRHDHSHHEAAE